MDVIGIKIESAEKDIATEIKSEPVETGTVSNGTDLCEPCWSENIVAKADGECKECEDLMCSTCFRHHLKAKHCRHHKFIDANTQSIKTEKGNAEKCKHHGGETIKFYCKKHETVGCRDCMVVEHSACNMEYITHLSTNFQEADTFKCLLIKFDELKSDIDKSEERIHESKISNELWHEKTLEQIRKFRQDIDYYLEVAETALVSELNQLRNSNSTYLTKLEEDCKALASKVERLKQKLNADLYQDNALFIHTVKCKLYIPSLEKAIANVEVKHHIRTFEFVPDKQLSNIVTASKRLGHFDPSKSITSAFAPVSASEHNTISIGSRNSRLDAGNIEHIYEERKFRKRRTQEVDVDNASVGARVRPGPCFTYDWDHHNKPGTVTSVEPDGTVTVQWDATGKLWSGYRVGTVWNGVQLI